MAACAALERAGVSPTTFEIGTALAFWYFREAGVQVAVVECGLGGRLDCTNVITPTVSMIAAIGMDHMAQLGDTIEDIAREKAGIIKPGVPAVVMRQSEEIIGYLPRKGRDHRRRGAGAGGDHPLRQPLSPALRGVFHPPARAAPDAQRIAGALRAARLGA